MTNHFQTVGVVGAGAIGMAFTDALIDHADVDVTRDEQVLVDIDLAILGADTLRFDEYERQNAAFGSIAVSPSFFAFGTAPGPRSATRTAPRRRG